MTPNILLFSVLGIMFLIVIYIKFSDIHKEKNKNSEQIDNNKEEDEDSQIKDFDEDFFKATQNGEPYQQFLSLASQRDCSILRSLLQADNIPTYCEGEHMNNIYGGIAGTMNAVVAIKLYILEKDYDTAYEIVKGFIDTKIEKFNSKPESKEKESAKKVADILSAVVFQQPLISSQEILGITVFPKAQK